MYHIPAVDFSKLDPAKLRLEETKYLFEWFKSARNAHPNQGLFLLTVYFDSLLFCLVSIEEMVDEPTRKKLRSLDSFLFFKALRNISTHHSVLSGVRGRFERPIARLVSISIGCEQDFGEQFFVVPDKLERIFDQIIGERPQEKKTIERARSYLNSVQSTGRKMMLVDLIQAVIEDVEPCLA